VKEPYKCKKFSFDTMVNADAYIWKKKFQGNPTFKVDRAYECPDCGKYHLTSKKRRS